MNQVTNVCRCAFPSHDCLHPRGPWKESEVLNQLPEEPQKLVGGFNPFENISQIGNLPQIWVNIKIV